MLMSPPGSATKVVAKLVGSQVKTEWCSERFGSWPIRMILPSDGSTASPWPKPTVSGLGASIGIGTCSTFVTR